MTKTMDMEAFLERQLKLVEAELRVEVGETEAVLSNCSQGELQRRGVALYNVHITAIRTGFRGKTVLEIEPVSGGRDVFPAHRITVGDLVSVAEPESSASAASSKRSTGETASVSNGASRGVTGVVSRVQDARLSIVADCDDIADALSDKCRVAKLANQVTYQRMKFALADLQRITAQPMRMSTLQRVLLNQEQPLFPSGRPSTAGKTSEKGGGRDLRFFDSNLNDSQKDAVRFALSADSLALVHGPPGTGKTFTLVEIIRQLAKQKKRMLVCGPSNISVDNLVERLAKCRIPLVRLGHPARMLPAVLDHALDVVTRTSDAGRLVEDIRKEMDELYANIKKSTNRADRRSMYAQAKDLRKDYKQRERDVVDGILRNSQVVLSTLNGAGGKIIRDQEFDVVIIDEATQAVEAECWIALLKGQKAILAGDHLQLPPTIKSQRSGRKNERGLEFTLFERMLEAYGPKIKRLLNVQYRMNQLIMAYPSRELYDGELTAASAVKDRLLTDLNKKVKETEDTTIALLLIDTTGCGMIEQADGGDNPGAGKVLEDADQSKYNEGEADLVAAHVKALVKDAGLPDGDIAVITPYNAQVSLLKKMLKDEYPNLEIGSVDGFQGREKEAVILSLVRSNDNQEVGFLAEKRRINVAITRPKRHLCLICDSETVSSDTFIGGFCDYIMEEGEVRYAQAQ